MNKAISIILCFVSIILAGMSMLAAVAQPRDYTNAYITPEGTWTRAPLDLQDQHDVKELARSVGAEIHVLRATKKLIIQSNNYGFIAAVSGVLAALIATTGMFAANKSTQQMQLTPRR